MTLRVDLLKGTLELSTELFVLLELLFSLDKSGSTEWVSSAPFLIIFEKVGVGAVISHRINGIDRPIAYASKTLSAAERNYSQLDKEALALIFGVKHFH